MDLPPNKSGNAKDTWVGQGQTGVGRRFDDAEFQADGVYGDARLACKRQVCW